MAVLGIGTVRTEVDQKGLDKGFKKSEKKSKGFFSSFGGVMKGALSTALGFGIFSLAQKGIGMVVGGITDLVMEAPKIEAVSNTFANLTDSIGESADAMLGDLQLASRGMVSDFDLMQATNRFMSMGLADSSESAAELTEVATQLASAMGIDATTGMADFAAMLANQSIPRLDNFGISSGVVRERINELMESEEGMTRETAFMTAVMESAQDTMGKIGEQGDSTAAGMARMQASSENLKAGIGEALMPIIESVVGLLTKLAELALPAVEDALESLMPFFEDVAGAIDIFAESGDVEGALRSVVGDEAIDTLLAYAEKFQPVIDAVTSLWETFEEDMPLIEQTVKDMIDFVTGLFEGDGQESIDTLIRALEWLEEFWDEHGDEIIEIVGYMWATVGIIVSTAIDLLLLIVNTTLDILEGDWEGAWERIKEFLSNFLDKVLAMMGTDLEEFTAIWSKNLEDAKLIVALVMDKIMKSFNEKTEGIRKGFNDVKDSVNSLIDRVKAFFTKVRNFSLPDWVKKFLPGSPVPFAFGLEQTRDAMKALGREMPSFRRALDIPGAVIGSPGAGQAALAGAGPTFQITGQYKYNPERDLVDEIRLLQKMWRPTS
jgi:phage-related protein